MSNFLILLCNSLYKGVKVKKFPSEKGVRPQQIPVSFVQYCYYCMTFT